MAKKTLSQAEKQVDIWKISVQDYNIIPENILSKDELLKAARFLHSKDRASFVSRKAAFQNSAKQIYRYSPFLDRIYRW